MNDLLFVDRKIIRYFNDPLVGLLVGILLEAEVSQEPSDGWFSITHNFIAENYCMSFRVQKRLFDVLKQYGVVSVELRGLPAKNFYKFNYDKLNNMIDIAE